MTPGNEVPLPHPQAPRHPAAPIGIVINPVSGRDTRRLFARAMSSSNESKRNQIERLLVGAAASGARRAVLVGDPFRIANSAVEALGVDLEIDLRDIGASCKPGDTERAALLMRDQGCAAIAVLGGDGTSRTVAKAWADAPMLPLSTGTNNVFPIMTESTVAGAALGLIAGGHVSIDEGARPCKVVRVEIEGEPDDLALIDAILMENDSTGNLLPFDPHHMRSLVVTRARPDAVGMSPVAGLLMPLDADEDSGGLVECIDPHDHASGQPLLAPSSPGLNRPGNARSVRRPRRGERVEVVGPGLLAFDGDRERDLAPGQRAWLRVERDGPRVIDIARCLQLAAQRGSYLGRAEWRDSKVDSGFECC